VGVRLSKPGHQQGFGVKRFVFGAGVLFSFVLAHDETEKPKAQHTNPTEGHPRRDKPLLSLAETSRKVPLLFTPESGHPSRVVKAAGGRDSSPPCDATAQQMGLASQVEVNKRGLTL